MLLDKLKDSFDKNVIKNDLSKKEDANIPSAIRNTLAFIIDFFVLGVIRLSFILLSAFFVNFYRKKFISNFEKLFGDVSNFDVSVAAHRTLLFGSGFGKAIVVLLLICVLIGIVYNSFMLSFNWSATIGRRVAKIYITNYDGSRLSLQKSIIRAVLMYIPWFLPFLAYYTWYDYRYFSFFMLFLCCFWNDTYIFSGKRIGIHDVLVKTMPRIGVVN